MTKFYEEFLRGPAGRLIIDLGEGAIRGEVTLIVAGRSGAAPEYSDKELLHCYQQVRHAGGEELSVRDMADRIAQETGVSRRRIYRLLLNPPPTFSKSRKDKRLLIICIHLNARK